MAIDNPSFYHPTQPLELGDNQPKAKRELIALTRHHQACKVLGIKPHVVLIFLQHGHLPVAVEKKDI